MRPGAPSSPTPNGLQGMVGLCGTLAARINNPRPFAALARLARTRTDVTPACAVWHP